MSAAALEVHDKKASLHCQLLGKDTAGQSILQRPFLRPTRPLLDTQEVIRTDRLRWQAGHCTRQYACTCVRLEPMIWKWNSPSQVCGHARRCTVHHTAYVTGPQSPDLMQCQHRDDTVKVCQRPLKTQRVYTHSLTTGCLNHKAAYIGLPTGQGQISKHASGGGKGAKLQWRVTGANLQ